MVKVEETGVSYLYIVGVALFFYSGNNDNDG